MHIKLKRIEHVAPCKYIFCPYIHSTFNGVKGKRKFLEVAMLHIKLKRIEHVAPCKYIFCPYIHSTFNGVKGKRKFLEVAMLHIKLIVMELRVLVHFLSLQTPSTCGLAYVVKLHIKFKGKKA